jgi:hypothetical protein
LAASAALNAPRRGETSVSNQDRALPASAMQRGAFPSQERNSTQNHCQNTADDVYL